MKTSLLSFTLLACLVGLLWILPYAMGAPSPP
jgi:hypothetical protein